MNWPALKLPTAAASISAGIDLRVVDRFPARFRDQIADGLAFLFQVALKVGPSTPRM